MYTHLHTQKKKTLPAYSCSPSWSHTHWVPPSWYPPFPVHYQGTFHPPDSEAFHYPPQKKKEKWKKLSVIQLIAQFHECLSSFGQIFTHISWAKMTPFHSELCLRTCKWKSKNCKFKLKFNFTSSIVDFWKEVERQFHPSLSQVTCNWNKWSVTLFFLGERVQLQN